MPMPPSKNIMNIIDLAKMERGVSQHLALALYVSGKREESLEMLKIVGERVSQSPTPASFCMNDGMLQILAVLSVLGDDVDYFASLADILGVASSGLLLSDWCVSASAMTALFDHGLPACMSYNARLSVPFLAAEKGSVKILDLLTSEFPALLSESSGKMTLLMQSASSGNGEVMKMLLSKGAKPSARPSSSEYPPLGIAAISGHAEVVKVLLSSKASPTMAMTLPRDQSVQDATGKKRSSIPLILELGVTLNSRIFRSFDGGEPQVMTSDQKDEMALCVREILVSMNDLSCLNEWRIPTFSAAISTLESMFLMAKRGVLDSAKKTRIHV